MALLDAVCTWHLFMHACRLSMEESLGCRRLDITAPRRRCCRRKTRQHLKAAQSCKDIVGNDVIGTRLARACCGMTTSRNCKSADSAENRRTRTLYLPVQDACDMLPVMCTTFRVVPAQSWYEVGPWGTGGRYVLTTLMRGRCFRKTGQRFRRAYAAAKGFPQTHV